jgi:release factor glutamine methyltransferase
MRTIAEALHEATVRLRLAAGDDARLEAEVLLAHALRIDRAHLLARLRDELSPGAAGKIHELVERRCLREPLAYIVGQREFCGINIICGPAALIPRPETEMLVDVALEEIERRGEDLRIIDVGTGTGAVALAIAARSPRAHLEATDSSEQALSLASVNAAALGLADRVAFRLGDLLTDSGEYDVIVSNLPYVSEREWAMLAPEIRQHEPPAALVGGAVGTEVIERLLAAAADRLAAEGLLAAEIGETQAPALLMTCRRVFRNANAYVMKDFAGKNRVLVVRREGVGVGNVA